MVKETSADVVVGEVAGDAVPKPTPGGMEPEEGASVDDAVACSVLGAIVEESPPVVEVIPGYVAESVLE